MSPPIYAASVVRLNTGDGPVFLRADQVESVSEWLPNGDAKQACVRTLTGRDHVVPGSAEVVAAVFWRLL